MEEIITLIVAITPSITAIIGCIVTFLKNKGITTQVVDKFEEVRQEIFNTKEYDDLKAQLKIAHQENYQLKCKLNELLTKIDKIQRNNDDDEV